MTSLTTDQPSQEPEPRTAEIVLFRGRKPAQTQPVESTPTDIAGQERLARALVALNNALAEQRAAVTAWREALTNLKDATGSLGQSLEQYRTNLTTLSDGVSGLRSQAEALRTWAETASPTDKG